MAVPATPAMAADGGVSADGGGDTSGRPGKARLRNGKAIPPSDAPRRVVGVIDAANRIAKGKGYCYGGGHSSFKSRCYDCSGAVSYALHGGRFVKSPMPSSGYMRGWGKRGKGRWITTFAKSSHMYMEVAGLRFDTSNTKGAGPGWAKDKGPRAGFKQRHPAGY
jgi:hypothetical protein